MEKIDLWSVELMTQGSSTVTVERFVRKYIVWYKTLILVVNKVLFGKDQEDFDSSNNRKVWHCYSHNEYT